MAACPWMSHPNMAPMDADAPGVPYMLVLRLQDFNH